VEDAVAAQRHDMPRLEYLFAAYTAVWILIYLYVRVLARRNERLEKDIEELRELVEKRR
jgi:CcmD family protein